MDSDRAATEVENKQGVDHRWVAMSCEDQKLKISTSI